MEKLPKCFMSVLLLVTVLRAGSAENAYYGEGRDLVLRPPFSGEITSITWKHMNNLVAEWIKGKIDLEYYDVFKGRTTLNITTGTLEITNMSSAYDGVYTVEINNKVQPVSYTTKLIVDVPQPTVDLKPLSCGSASPTCSLHCEGKSGEAVTEEKYGPVTYSWKIGDKQWIDGEKSRTIHNDKETQSIETFSCQMKNLISEKQSKAIDNKFYNANPGHNSGGGGNGWIAGVVIPILLIAGGAVAYVKREDLKKFFLKSDGGNTDNNTNNGPGQPLMNKQVNGNPDTTQSEGVRDVKIPMEQEAGESDGGQDGEVSNERAGGGQDGEVSNERAGGGQDAAAGQGGDGGAAAALTGDAEGGTGLDSKPADDGHNVESNESSF